MRKCVAGCMHATCRHNRNREYMNFYKNVMRVAVPIMIQNGITNLVGMLDNVMVGRLGTDAMSGVAIVNQLMFIFNLCIFGALSGIGIFTAQFYGKGDDDGIRHTVRQQVLVSVFLAIVGAAVFLFWGDPLIRLYLHSDGSGGSVEATFAHAKDYLTVMYAGLLPFALAQVYSSTLRNTGETMIPMEAGVAAVAVNLLGNYILIYGKLGAPRLGVAGAAVATVISRFAELAIVAVWTHRHTDRNPFIRGVYRRLFAIPAVLNRQVAMKGMPLLLNETFWAGAQAALTQNYSIRGLSAVAAVNISQTISNVFNVSFIAMGSAIAILLGQMLGAGEIERAKRDAHRLTRFSVVFCLAFGVVQFAIAGLFPHLYNTSQEVRRLASGLIRIGAVFMPVYAYVNAAYFIIRSGGKTVITFFFDSVYSWVVVIPAVYVAAHFTGLPLYGLFLIVQLTELIKCFIGYFLVKRGAWAVNLTRPLGNTG